MKIEIIHRAKNEAFHSIESIWESLIPFIKPGELEQFYVPKKKLTLLNILKNILFCLQTFDKNSDNIRHITGDILYLSPFIRGKKIITVHDLQSALQGNYIKRKLMFYFWFKIPFKLSQQIHCISEKTKEEILHFFPKIETKIIVIPNPINSRFYQESKALKKSNQVIVIGTKSNKNLTRILNSTQGLDITLNIIGKETRELTEHSNQNFRLQSNLSLDEIVNLYKESTLLLFPSLYEGFGIPIVEAQAIGTAVITSNISPMFELSGGSAILVNPESEEDIRGAVINVLNNHQLRIKLETQGKINAQKYYPSKVLEEYKKMYTELSL